MLVRRLRGWELSENAVSDEAVFRERRRLVRALAGGSILAAGAPLFVAGCDGDGPSNEYGDAPTTVRGDPSAKLYPVARNPRYQAVRPVTAEALASSYNNFIEFGSQKSIWRQVQALQTRPWLIEIDGLVAKPLRIGIDDLLARVSLEERVYRHRCVEAWAMVVPWTGFPLKSLVELAAPLGSAKYVQFQSFHNPEIASSQTAKWYSWPYTEALTIAEATNELAFLVTGAYGKPIAKQYGAPLRLALPWKYGFKHIKSVQRITFVENRPKTFWEEAAKKEYGFWANVNPDVPHRRWSQKTERLLGSRERVPTRIFNGYGEFVADIYQGLEGEKLFM